MDKVHNITSDSTSNSLRQSSTTNPLLYKFIYNSADNRTNTSRQKEMEGHRMKWE